MNKIMQRQYHQAKVDGRLCSNCKWMISKKNWAKGYRLCGNCWDAMRGVNAQNNTGPYRDDPEELTGEW